MPRVIEPSANTHVMTVEEAAEAISQAGFKAREEESVLAVAEHLAALGRNGSFLGDLLVDVLTGRTSGPASAYSPQSIMLTRPRDGFFLRANIWPSLNDSCVRRSGAHNFAYGSAHDHNFDFLTYGYFGPGYGSDYYEYDHEALAGYVGEPAGLRFIERSMLSQGKLMHYRAHRDVHSQLPPESLSVSLNVMACDPAQGWHDQYGFDVESDTIARVLSHGSTETFLRIAVALGDDEALDLARRWGRGHPSDRIRLASYEARANAAGDLQAAHDIWREGEESGSRLVAHEASKRRRLLA